MSNSKGITPNKAIRRPGVPKPSQVKKMLGKPVPVKPMGKGRGR